MEKWIFVNFIFFWDFQIADYAVLLMLAIFAGFAAVIHA
jgi:hypothetical protein